MIASELRQEKPSRFQENIQLGGSCASTWSLPLWTPPQTPNPNPEPVVLIERVDATVHITACSSNMAPEAPVMLNQRGAQQRPLDPISSSVTIWVG